MRRGALTLIGVAILACSKSEPAAPVAASLDLFVGGKFIAMAVEQFVRVDPVLLGVTGDTLPLPAGFTVVSRDSTKVSIDSGRLMHSRAATPLVYIVGTVFYQGKLFADSLGVAVTCP